FSVCLSRRLGNRLFLGSRRIAGDKTPARSMRETILHGKTSRNTTLDQLPKENLYAVAPLEHLSGEITIINGELSISKVNSNGKILVAQDWTMGAPFIVYSNVSKWTKFPIPDSIRNLQELE